MKVLVFGRTGQVARELARCACDAVDMTLLGRDEADLRDPEACAASIAARDADVVINAAAYTDVDGAEREEALATRVNAAAPTAMARAAAAKAVPFLHLSTDYVFDGSGTAPWPASAPVSPLGAYGRSKAEGEAGVRAAGGPHVILRTSWVFSAGGSNFPRSILRAAAARNRLAVVSDQIGGPTAATDIAAALLRIAARLWAAPGLSGTYHFAGSPDVSRAEFARAVLAVAGRTTPVDEIASADYPCAAPRPLNCRLDCGTTQTVFGMARPDWRPALATALAELGETQA